MNLKFFPNVFIEYGVIKYYFFMIWLAEQQQVDSFLSFAYFIDDLKSDSNSLNSDNKG